MVTKTESSKDYYAVLGVSPDSNQAEITKAYRRLAMKLHPDRPHAPADAEEQFKEVSAAYEILSNPEKRQRYDRFHGQDPFGYGMSMEESLAQYFKNKIMDTFIPSRTPFHQCKTWEKAARTQCPLIFEKPPWDITEAEFIESIRQAEELVSDTRTHEDIYHAFACILIASPEFSKHAFSYALRQIQDQQSMSLFQTVLSCDTNYINVSHVRELCATREKAATRRVHDLFSSALQKILDERPDLRQGFESQTERCFAFEY